MKVFKNTFFKFLKDSFSKKVSEKYVPKIIFIISFLGFIVLYLSSLFKIFFVFEWFINSINELILLFNDPSLSSLNSISSKELLSLDLLLVSLTNIYFENSPYISGEFINSKFLFWIPSKLSLLPELLVYPFGLGLLPVLPLLLELIFELFPVLLSKLEKSFSMLLIKSVDSTFLNFLLKIVPWIAFSIFFRLVSFVWLDLE